ncbi:MAG: ABC transporter permease [Bacteroidales bacterium]|nr:ABC transporter permease [Candidatus Latescibacterota bacterium]
MMERRLKPPALAVRILAHIASTTEPASLLGDIEEEFRYRATTDSPAKAKAWYWLQILRSVGPFIINSTVWSVIMLSSYLKVAVRNMTRHKSYTLINLSGLAIGIACSVLMLMWVADELSFDRFHSRADRIHRVLLDPLGASDKHEAVSPPPLAAKMKSSFPEVENAFRMASHGGKLMIVSDMKFNESGGIMADPEIFEIFDFHFIKGDPANVLTDIHSVVLSKSLAEKYFGTENPIGETINFNNSTDFTVTGVFTDVPENSHLRFSFVRPFELLAESGRDLDNWGDISFHTYVLLSDNASPEVVDAKIKTLIEAETNGHNMYYLQPLTEIHLHSDFNFDNAVTGNVLYVYIFSAGAVFILLIACINFMNLATARSGIRAREVGMRKVVGAARADIVRQFFGESIMSSMIATVLAVILIQMALPVFNELSGKSLALGSSGMGHWSILAGGLFLLALLTGIISGSYPALFLSSFHPAKVLKSARSAGTGGSGFRKGLVVLQFSLTIILLIGTMVVHRQLGYIRSMDLGYDSEHIVVMPMRSGEIRKRFKTLKTEFQGLPGVKNVTFASAILTNIGSGTSGAWWEGKPDDVRLQIQAASVDPDYLETFGMEMAVGEFFEPDEAAQDTPFGGNAAEPLATDGADGETPPEVHFVVNEAAVRAMGLADPVGWPFKAMGAENGKIIGVVRDFNYKSAHSSIDPLFMISAPEGFYYVCVRMDGADIPGTIASMEKSWKAFAPQFTFDYSFMDERLDALYRTEQRMVKLFNYFTFLAIFIACLGLFGMASFTAERRTKEIGIRKALGASIGDIVRLLSMEFTRLVLLANVIAWPIAWLAMNRWLQSFAFRVDLSIWLFAAAGAAAFVVAFLTVASQAIKAAVTRPVEALKYE